MLERVFDYGNQVAAREVGAASKRLYELASRTVQGAWHTERVDDHKVNLCGAGGQHIATLTGLWAPTTATYLTVMSPDLAYRVAEVMTVVESNIRRGELSPHLHTAFYNLAKGLPGE